MVTHALRPLSILISITQSIFVPSFTLFTESAQFGQIPELAAPLICLQAIVPIYAISSSYTPIETANRWFPAILITAAILVLQIIKITY